MPMTEQRRSELAEFLRKRRSTISPGTLGLRSTTRRRVKGLRRDEVAELADISVTWYTWLEQGRDINVSPHALERIADALQCGDEERSYMFQLAGENPPSPTRRPDMVPPNLQILLDAMDLTPAYAITSRFDVVAWNATAGEVFGDFAKYPEGLRNLLWILMTEPSMRELFAEWERFARCIIASFRQGYSKAFEEPEWSGLVSALERASPDFRVWWQLREVAKPPDWRRTVRHRIGTLCFDPITLLVGSAADLAIVAFTPAEGTGTAERLRELGAATTTEEWPPEIARIRRGKAAV